MSPYTEYLRSSMEEATNELLDALDANDGPKIIQLGERWRRFGDSMIDLGRWTEGVTVAIHQHDSASSA